jgi:hypothetical protein
MEFSEWLLLEIESNILIRPEQGKQPVFRSSLSGCLCEEDQCLGTFDTFDLL